MSGPLHIGLTQQLVPACCRYHSNVAPDFFPKLEMYLHEAQTHQLLAQLDSGQA